MYTVRPPFFFRFFDEKYLVTRFSPEEKKIRLTFDDGPVPGVTPLILEILAKKEVPATFFCVGDNVRKHRSVFEEVVAAGHSIGNHTYSHLNGWKTPPAFYVENVTRCRDYFDTNLFRPPYGKFTPSQYFLLRKEFRFIMWSVLSGDFHRNTSAEKCLEQTVENSGNGSIVVFHDNPKTQDKVLQVLPQFIDLMIDKGLTFEKL